MSHELLTTLSAVQANARRLIGGVAADQWELSTPCTEWNVADLVNHMGFTNRILAAAARREAPTFAPDDDHVGADRLAGFDALATANESAWNVDGALDGDVEVPAAMPAVGALSANVLDIGTHCWDLATATGQAHGLTAEQIGVIDRCNRGLIDADVRAGGGFGEELAAGDGDAMTAMLAFVGRRG